MVFLSELLKNEYSFIRNSEFYESLINNTEKDDEEEEEQEIDLDLKVCPYNSKDFKLYVKVLNFWGPRVYPNEFHDLLLYSSKEARQNRINGAEEVEVEMKREVLKEYIEVTNSERFKFYLEILNCKFNSDPLKINQITTITASYGYLDFLFYCYEHEYKWDAYACSAAAGNGHLECLTFLHENGCIWNTFTCGEAAKNGHLSCLKYAHENGCHWNSYILTESAYNDRFECFKYTIDKDNSILNYHVYNLIIRLDKLNFFIYVIKNNYRFNEETLLTLVVGEEAIKCLDYMYKNYLSLFTSELCITAVNMNKLGSLIFLHERGIQWDERVCNASAYNGNLKCLKYAHENGCPWNSDTTLSCTYNESIKNIECLKYCHENGCPWNSDITLSCVRYGNIECLKYCHENGCLWDEDTCIEASSVGCVECLIYAHENGCPWNIRVLSEASNYDHLECLEYAILEQCPGYERYKNKLKKLKDAPKIKKNFFRSSKTLIVD